MKALTGFLLIFLLISTKTFAQIDTLRSRVPATGVPAHLRGIVRAPGSSALGAVYLYGDKRLRSPFSLEVPFHELDDPLVNRHYRAFRRFNTLGQVVATAPLFYVLLRPNEGRNRNYWLVFGGSVAASLVCTIGGNIQVGRAVRRYNEVLMQSRLGLSVTPGPGLGGPVVGMSLSTQFYVKKAAVH